MKKTVTILILMFTMTILMAACGDENESADSNKDKNLVSANESQKENNKEDEKEDSNEVIGDQLDLGIGDTGSFDTTLGTYDVTLVSAKLVDEIGGEKSELDRFIILDFIVKNTSQDTQNVEDIIYSLEVTEELDESGFSDGSEFFEGFKKLSGPLEPGEEMEGKFVTYVYDADEYYFRKDPGNVAGGSSNQVIWTIKADEIEQ